jgi:hypothetical protein
MPYPVPTPALHAKLAQVELDQRDAARARARSRLATPARAAAAIAIAICEVEAGNCSAAQLERLCHYTLWEAVATRVCRGGGPAVTAHSLLRVHVQERTPGLADAVVTVRRGGRVQPIAMRMDAAPGHWQIVELQY